MLTHIVIYLFKSIYRDCMLHTIFYIFFFFLCFGAKAHTYTKKQTQILSNRKTKNRIENDMFRFVQSIWININMCLFFVSKTARTNRYILFWLMFFFFVFFFFWYFEYDQWIWNKRDNVWQRKNEMEKEKRRRWSQNYVFVRSTEGKVNEDARRRNKKKNKKQSEYLSRYVFASIQANEQKQRIWNVHITI